MRYHLCALMAFLAVVACGNPGGDGGSPDVSDRYQTEIDEAWELAADGTAPTGTCAAVVGTAVARAGRSAKEREAAREAFRACYLDVRARFVEAYADAIEAGEEDCQGLAIDMVGGSGGLKSSAEPLDVDVDSLEAELEARVGDRVGEVCPGMVDAIL